MLVTNTKAGYNNTELDLPDNGVVYVDNDPAKSLLRPTPPSSTDYDGDARPGLRQPLRGRPREQEPHAGRQQRHDRHRPTPNGAGRKSGLLRDE